MPAQILGNARFTLLSQGLVRIEYSPDGRFEDRASIRIINRPSPLPFDDVINKPNEAVLTGGDFRITYIPDNKPSWNWDLFVHNRHSRKLVWQPNFLDNRNLGGVYKSLDRMQKEFIPAGVGCATVEHCTNDESSGQNMFVFDGKDAEQKGSSRRRFPPSILSQEGYFLYNDTPTAVLDDNGWICRRETHPEYRDYYLFMYGKDSHRALADYRLVFGTTPLPPRYMFGLWYSRFPTLKAKDIKQAVQDFAKHDLPLDVFVLDLEWHKRGWHGFDWDTDEYGEAGTFLQDLHERDIRVTANIHPDKIPVEDSRYEQFREAAGSMNDSAKIIMDGRDNIEKLTGFSLASRSVADAWMNVFHKPVQDQGLDFWWQDGGAWDHLHNTYNQLWTNHVYRRHMEQQYTDRRPMVFSRSSGLGSHRYPVHFTGDTITQWEVLAHEVEYTLRAGHMGLSFVSHDISGFSNQRVQPPDDLYARWVQYGCLSPIFRLHSAFGEERRPWNFTPVTLESFRKAIRLRIELLAYLYTLARESHDTCLPMCRSNPLMAADWQQGYDIWNSYFLGDRIYVTPITTQDPKRQVILPPGQWYSGISGDRYCSTGSEILTVEAPLDAPPPHFVKAGSLLVTQQYVLRSRVVPEMLFCTWYPKAGPAADRFELYEDDGLSRDFINGASCRTLFKTTESTPGSATFRITSGSYVPGLPMKRTVRLSVKGHSISCVTVGAQSAAPTKDGTWEVPVPWDQTTELVATYC